MNLGKVKGRREADLQSGLEWKLQLRASDDNVGEIQEMHLQRIQHTLT